MRERISDLKRALSAIRNGKGSKPNAFVERLRGYGALLPADEQQLADACQQMRSYHAGQDLIREGDEPGPVFVILEGWAARYKILPDGNRQIIAFMMPGDFCDMHIAVLDEMDHSIGALTDAVIATIQRPEMERLVDATPTLARTFWWSQLVEAAMLRATIVSMGRRSSLERVAHLLCELCFRLGHVGGADTGRYVMPFTQIVLADAVGLTPVHVNRVIRKLRLNDALEIDGVSIVISDLKTLARIAGFDDNYFHRRMGAGEVADRMVTTKNL